MHNAARLSMLDNSRDVQIERLNFAQKIYESTNRLQFGAKIDDPALPEALRDEVGREPARHLPPGHRPDGAPDVWAAVAAQQRPGAVPPHHFPDRFAVLDDLDQALVIGSIAVVVGGCALGVLVGGRLSRRLRKAAAAAGKLADGDTDGAGPRRDRRRSGTGRDRRSGAAPWTPWPTRSSSGIEAERRVTADIAHELRTPVTGLLTAAELLPPGRPTELVRDRAQALRTLVEDVLEVARLDGHAERAELQDDRARRVRHPAGARPRPGHRRRWSYGTPRSPPTRAGWSGSSAICSPTPPGTASRRSRSPSRAGSCGSATTARASPRRCCAEGPSRFRTGSSDRAGRGHGLGLTIAAGQARVLGARLTFRNADELTDGSTGARLRPLAAGERADQHGQLPGSPCFRTAEPVARVTGGPGDRVGRRG